jgi:hypothetical protein
VIRFGKSPDRKFTAQADVFGRGPDEDAEDARFDDPLQIAIEHLQLVGADRECQRCALARREVDAAESFQFDDRARNSRNKKL